MEIRKSRGRDFTILVSPSSRRWLTVLRTFFEFLARRCPESLAVAQQIAAIAVKRTPPPETFFLERDEVSTLLRRLPTEGRHARRDRALVLLLYNTGARVQEIADLRLEHMTLGDSRWW